MATSKDRRGVLFGRITKKTMVGVFGVCQEKKRIFSHTGKSWKYDNSK
jgi:hypothetical protein